MAIHKLRAGDIKGLVQNNCRTKHSDGGGLILQVMEPGQASWLFRYFDKAAGKELWPSIGPAATYTLDEAREKARQCRIELKEGRSPKNFLANGRAAPTGKLFATALEEYLAAKSPTWAASNRERELRRYRRLFGELPDFTGLPLRAIDQHAKNKALSIFEAGSKKHRDVGFYIEAIIRYAESGKLRIVGNGGSIEHHDAMPYAEVPGFYQRLGALGTADARALQWTILTGARTDEVIGGAAKAPATWGEIVGDVWVIPAERMKGRKEHRVPLSAAALALLGKRGADSSPLFKVSSQNGMLNTLKRADGNSYTVHGFRTSFTEYVAAETDFADDLADRCIAHERRGKVRRAYQRDDLLAKRREIMQRWSDFVTA